jgi:hypothetical protein
MCMSSIDHSHIRDVTDVRWLSSVAFSREGAACAEVRAAHTSLNVWTLDTLHAILYVVHMQMHVRSCDFAQGMTFLGI